MSVFLAPVLSWKSTSFACRFAAHSRSASACGAHISLIELPERILKLLKSAIGSDGPGR
jgi:hypothetical protein